MTRRILGIVVLVLSMIVLLAPTTSPQSTCCQKCLERFQQCDGTTIVCCKIYNSCIAQCQGTCQSCPDQ
jgi:hypothetical protein